MKKVILSLFLVGLFLTGCMDNNDSASWKATPTFTEDGTTLYGIDGKFGVSKVNGETDEPEFPATQGRLYDIHFLENELNGENYKITATHQDTGNIVTLTEQEMYGKYGQAKFGFDESGLWKIDVTVDDEPYTDFIVEAK